MKSNPFSGEKQSSNRKSDLSKSMDVRKKKYLTNEGDEGVFSGHKENGQTFDHRLLRASITPFERN